MQSERVACPSCGKEYPVPEKLWHSGRLAVRCPHCGKRFILRFPVGGEPPEVDVSRPLGGEVLSGGPEKTDSTEPIPPPEKTVGEEAPDPALMKRRARRLARALVGELARGRESERKKSLEDGSLLLVFGEAIRGAWEQFQVQAPAELPEAQHFFREALNEVLAEGQSLF